MSLIVKSTDVLVRGSITSFSALALAALASSVFLISSRRFMSSAFLSSLVGLATTAGWSVVAAASSALTDANAGRTAADNTSELNKSFFML